MEDSETPRTAVQFWAESQGHNKSLANLELSAVSASLATLNRPDNNSGDFKLDLNDLESRCLRAEKFITEHSTLPIVAAVSSTSSATEEPETPTTAVTNSNNTTLTDINIQSSLTEPSKAVFDLHDDSSASDNVVLGDETTDSSADFTYVYPAVDAEFQQPTWLPPRTDSRCGLHARSVSIPAIPALRSDPNDIPEASSFSSTSADSLASIIQHSMLTPIAGEADSVVLIENPLIHEVRPPPRTWSRPSTNSNDFVEPFPRTVSLNVKLTDSVTTQPAKGTRKWSINGLRWPLKRTGSSSSSTSPTSDEDPQSLSSSFESTPALHPRVRAALETRRDRPYSFFVPSIPTAEPPPRSPVRSVSVSPPPASYSNFPEKEIPVNPTIHKAKIAATQINQYLLLKEIGRGVHGVVRLAYDTLSGKTVAVKCIGRKKRSLILSAAAREQAELRREIAVLKKVSGFERCVGLLEVIEDHDSNETYLVLEHMPGGSICWQRDFSTSSESLLETQPLWNDDSVRPVFRDVLLGLAFLHSRGIVHRDIKPANLLVDADNRVRISDFGTSLWEDGDGARTEGTPAFWAPEMVGFVGTMQTLPKRSESRISEFSSTFPMRQAPDLNLDRTQILGQDESAQPTPAVDLWALGATLYCLLFGRTPFSGSTEWALFRSIRCDDVIFPANVPISRACLELIHGLLTKDPSQRWTIEQCALWPWTTEGMLPEDREVWVGSVLSFAGVGTEVAEMAWNVGEEEMGKAVGVLVRT